MTFDTSNDTGAYIAQIVGERDDAIGTLRMRESDVRLLTRQLRDERDYAARLETLLHRAINVAETESAAGKVSTFITKELEVLKATT